MNDELLTITEIARQLEVNKEAVRRWTKKPGWPEGVSVVRSGRQRVAYPWSAVRAFCRREGLPKRIISLREID